MRKKAERKELESELQQRNEVAPSGSICDEIVEGRFLAMMSARKAAASNRTYDAIRRLLSDANVPFREIEHGPTYTSEESAKARGEDLSVGAKALLVKVDGDFKLLVIPAHQKLNSTAVKREFRAKKVRFATADELKELTDLVPGSVPPFGEPILPFPVCADLSVGGETDKIAFNAGSLTRSIVMKASDWKAVAKPHRFSFAK